MPFSILIVKTSALGDVIQTLDAVLALHAADPGVQIDWVVEEPMAPFLRRFPQIRTVIPVATGRWKKNPFAKKTFHEVRAAISSLRRPYYDVAVDLQGNCKSAVLLRLCRASVKFAPSRSRELGSRWLVRAMRVQTDQTEGVRGELQAILASAVGRRFSARGSPVLALLSPQENMQATAPDNALVIGLGSRWEHKRLSKEQWEQLLTNLAAKRPYFFIFLVTEAEHSLAHELLQAIQQRGGQGEIRMNLDLAICQHLIASCQGFIGVDSVLLHLATTTNCRAVGIFGPSSAAYYLKGGAFAIQGSCPYNISFTDRCPALRSCATGACSKTLRPETMADQILSALETVQVK